MENLHPAAQVAAVIMIGLVVCVWFITLTSDFFDNIFRRKK
jgi:hypothetical protein